MARLTSEDKEYLRYMKKEARVKYMAMDFRTRKKLIEEAKKRSLGQSAHRSTAGQRMDARKNQKKLSGSDRSGSVSNRPKTAPYQGAVSKVAHKGVRATQTMNQMVAWNINQMLRPQKETDRQEDSGQTSSQDQMISKSTETVNRLLDRAERLVRFGRSKQRTQSKFQWKKFTTKRALTRPVGSGLTGAARKAVKGFAKLIAQTVKLAALNPIYWLLVAGVLFVVLIASFGMGSRQYVNISSESNPYYDSPLSDAVEGYRAQVKAACEKYHVPDYVDLALAMMQQESGGTGNDPMQASEGPFNKKYPQKPGGITDPAYSIACGVQEMKSCLIAAKVTGPTNIKKISLALQGYNYGNGYIAWAIDRDGGYTKENARAFSEMMKKKMGWKTYGDPEYVQHVLRYYSQTATVSSGTDAAAKKIIGSLYQKAVKNGVGHVCDRFKVIAAGARLIGKCGYSRDSAKNPRNGSDNPAYLDCSSFVAWSYNKAGFSPVPYTAYTGTFLQTKNFVTIDKKKLQPGDIGLNNANASGGGTNHVGIYLGVYQGKELWMHCTSGRSDRVAGNNSGVMISPHPNFAIFKRYKVWN